MNIEDEKLLDEEFVIRTKCKKCHRDLNGLDELAKGVCMLCEYTE